MNLTVRLPRVIEPPLAPKLEKIGVAISPAVRRMRIGPDRATLEVECDDDVDVAELREKIDRWLSVAAAPPGAYSHRPVFTNARRDRGPLTAGVYEQLRQRGWVVELGRGRVALAGPAHALERALDAALAATSRGRFGAAEVTYPSLVSSEFLAKLGYFEAFPHAVGMVTHVVDDAELNQEVRKACMGTGQLHVPRREALKLPEVCLNPAACLPYYPSLSGRTIGAEGHVATSLCRVFRNEDPLVGIQRLFEFTVRETIFIGTEQQVAARRQAAIELAQAQVREWDLDCSLETANDMFFPTKFADAEEMPELLTDPKYEMLLTLEPGEGGERRTVAGASFNLNQNFVGQLFDVTAADGAPAFSACTGFGLERWVLAMFTQHGFEPARWPEAVRALTFS